MQCNHIHEVRRNLSNIAKFFKMQKIVHCFLWSLFLSGMATGEEFRIPPEWERHTKTVMVWPASATIWGSTAFLGKVRGDIARIAKAIIPFEPVTLIVDPAQVATAKAAFSKSDLAENGGQITLLPIPVDDFWARDTIPVFGIQSAQGKPNLAGIDLNFNGWGDKPGKYNQEHGKDALVGARFLKSQNITRIASKIVGEAGALEFDGEGTLLVTESSMFNPNRNPDYTTRDALEAELKSLLGVSKVVWFKGVYGKDITDAHVDAFARFAAPGVVLLNRPPKGSTKSDIWSEASDNALKILKCAKDAKHRKFKIIQLYEPDPEKIETVKGRESDFLASYVNFLVVNGGVIVPMFGDEEADQEAKRVIESAYPGRKVVLVKITHLASGGGGIHCATHDIPSLVD